MNILFFLTPKSKVEYVFDDFTIRQALEKMSFHHYSAVPILSREGQYVGTLTEGDILWHIKNKADYSIKKAEKEYIKNINFKHKFESIKSTAKIEDLIQLTTNQNFVPVVDDTDTFIGIITRSEIINYCRKEMYKEKE